ncbi:MAG: tetratricopeptide repeat protein [Ignavibacteriae bacterium]|nr:tetratricopeptide repeat protein [Ignavibacteriota bacterium]
MTAVAEHVQAGLEHHRAGRLDDAAREYGYVLTADPSNVAVLRLMGILHTHRGDHDQAVMVLQAAAALEPGAAEIFNDLGLALRAKGDVHAALDAFNDALRLFPKFGPAHFNKGVTLEALGARVQAVDAYTLALEADAGLHAARFNRASIHFAAGQYAMAADDAGSVRLADPALLEAHVLYGRASLELRRLADAKKAFRAVITRAPGFAPAHTLLGSVYTIEHKFQDAAIALTEALRLDPADVQATFLLGLVRLHQYDLAAAHDLLDRARLAQPLRPEITTALAFTARRAGRLEDARMYLRAALDADPSYADAHWHLADLHLLLGEYEQGWEEFEWRWKHEGFLTPGWDPSMRAWQGEPVEGKTMLLYPEQGFGDTLHFVRYASLLTERGAHVYLGTPPELADLLAGIPGIRGVVTSRSDAPPCDVICPLMSLPRLFCTHPGNVPATVPYLFADPEKVRAWSTRFPDDGKLRIGIIWSGNPKQENNRHRACSLSDLLPLLGRDQCHVYSLQKGEPTHELADRPEASSVIDLSAGLTTFAETAAALQNIDVLISTDTGSVHLAGALGRPVWLLVSAIPDWRWGVSGATTPWYPDVTMFRQQHCGDWSGAVHAVGEALDTLLRSRVHVHSHRTEE